MDASKKGSISTVQRVLGTKFSRELKQNYVNPGKVPHQSQFQTNASSPAPSSVIIEEEDPDVPFGQLQIRDPSQQRPQGVPMGSPVGDDRFSMDERTGQVATISPQMNFVFLMDVNFQGLKGRTPLHWAVYQNHQEIVELLLVAGSDIRVKDNDEKTPLDVAKDMGRDEMIQLLLNPPPQGKK